MSCGFDREIALEIQFKVAQRSDISFKFVGRFHEFYYQGIVIL